jgi:hypothetical protein
VLAAWRASLESAGALPSADGPVGVAASPLRSPPRAAPRPTAASAAAPVGAAPPAAPPAAPTPTRRPPGAMGLFPLFAPTRRPPPLGATSALNTDAAGGAPDARAFDEADGGDAPAPAAPPAAPGSSWLYPALHASRDAGAAPAGPEVALEAVAAGEPAAAPPGPGGGRRAPAAAKGWLQLLFILAHLAVVAAVVAYQAYVSGGAPAGAGAGAGARQRPELTATLPRALLPSPLDPPIPLG